MPRGPIPVLEQNRMGGGNPLSHSHPQCEQTGVRSHFPEMLYQGSALSNILGLGTGDLREGSLGSHPLPCGLLHYWEEGRASSAPFRGFKESTLIRAAWLIAPSLFLPLPCLPSNS